MPIQGRSGTCLFGIEGVNPPVLLITIIIPEEMQTISLTKSQVEISILPLDSAVY